METLAGQLSHSTHEAIAARFAMHEEGAPYRLLTAQMGPQPVEVGAVRVWRGEKVAKMVYVGMTVPVIRLDSHMIFAFTPADSAAPHFTLDSVYTQPPGTEEGHYAFHLDLIPRVDLGANLPYIDHALQPLTPFFDAAAQMEGLSPAKLSPRQYALMSPWMLAYRSNEAAYQQITGPVTRYMEHWFSLVEQGIPADCFRASAAELAERDRHNRAGIFNPDVDPVWNQVERLIGAEMGAELRELLRSNE